jgi:L-fuconolactonase
MESFGSERVLFGSDWPVMLLSGTYDKWKMLIENYIHQFSETDKKNIFRNNAIRFYNILREAIN